MRIRARKGTLSFVPSYQEPCHRFLQGEGEMKLHSPDGHASTIWEFLAYAREEEYPLNLGGRSYTKEHLLLQALSVVNSLIEDGISQHSPNSNVAFIAAQNLARISGLDAHFKRTIHKLMDKLDYQQRCETCKKKQPLEERLYLHVENRCSACLLADPDYQKECREQELTEHQKYCQEGRHCEKCHPEN